MKLFGMTEALEAQILEPNSDLKGFEERIADIINHEWKVRYNKKFACYLKKVTLRYPTADFDDSLYDADRLIDTSSIEELAPRRWRGFASPFFRNMHITTKYSNYFHMLSSLTYRYILLSIDI